jgi:predicted DCC family thiol-disulfide oxidoreductase YuxK
MTQADEECLNSPGGEHLILYDGVCGLCNRFVQFVLWRDAPGIFAYASLQSSTGDALLGQFGVDADLKTIYVIEDYRSASPRLLSKARAALFVMETLRIGFWPRLLRSLPWSWLDFGYDFVARYRYKIFGRTETCMLPREQFRSRFIDV